MQREREKERERERDRAIARGGSFLTMFTSMKFNVLKEEHERL